jgi:hypothetical protein
MRIVVGAVLCLVMVMHQALASGGGEVHVTRDKVQVSLQGPRKRPTPDYAQEWSRQVEAWNKDKQVVANKVVAAIEKDVLPRYRTWKVVAKSFGAGNYRDLSGEGISRSNDPTDSDVLWRLTIDLDLYPAGDVATKAVFMLKARPSKADVRAFTRDVQAAAAKVMGRTLPAKPTYAAFWLVADDGATSLLLSTVPLAKLGESLEKAPWRPMGFETFRRAPALLILTDGRKSIAPNNAGFLLANPTAANVEATGASVVLQVNGTYLPAMKVSSAKRAEVVRLIESAPASERADDVEFLATLKPALAK